ncbi:MAG: tetratricopeptide repeat protein [Planctomycetota bacterium]
MPLPQSTRSASASAAVLPESGELSQEQLLKLRLVEAQNLATRSGPGAAIETLLSTVREHADFAAGWQQLADWYRSLHDDEGLLAATGQLAALRPDEAAALAAHGEALARVGRRNDAERYFHRALKLDPGSTFAGFWLFDLLLEEQRLTESGRILESLRQHVSDDPFLLGREAQLAAALDDKDRANDRLTRICLSPGDVRWPLHAAAQALRKVGWRYDVREVLEAALKQPNVNSDAGSLWMRVTILDGHMPEDSELRELAGRNAAGLQAVATIGEAFQEAGHTDQAVEIVLRNRQWLRERTELWGMGGYVLAGALRYHDVIAWMSDWRGRSDVAAWMLVNLVEAQRAMGDDAAAREVSEFALTLPPDHGHDLHRIWLAFDRPFEQPELLEYVAMAVSPDSLSDGARFLQSLVAAMFSAGVGGGSQRPFDDVRSQIDAAISRYGAALKRERGHRRILRESIQQITACYDDWTPRLWGLKRWLY